MSKTIEELCNEGIAADIKHYRHPKQGTFEGQHAKRYRQILSLCEGWVSVEDWEKKPGERVMTMDDQGFEAICVWDDGWVLAPPYCPPLPLFNVEYVRAMPTPPEVKK